MKAPIASKRHSKSIITHGVAVAEAGRDKEVIVCELLACTRKLEIGEERNRVVAGVVAALTQVINPVPKPGHGGQANRSLGPLLIIRTVSCGCDH